jgi:hypothetical protein
LVISIYFYFLSQNEEVTMLAREEQKAAETYTPVIDAVKVAFAEKDPEELQGDIDHLKKSITSTKLKEYLNQQDTLGNTALHTCFMLYADTNLQNINSILQGKTKDQAREEAGNILILASKIASILVTEGCDTTLTNFAEKTALQNILHIEGVSPSLIDEGMSRFAKIDIRNMLTVSEKRQYFTTQVANDNGSQQNGKKKGGCLVM